MHNTRCVKSVWSWVGDTALCMTKKQPSCKGCLVSKALISLFCWEFWDTLIQIWCQDLKGGWNSSFGVSYQNNCSFLSEPKGLQGQWAVKELLRGIVQYKKNKHWRTSDCWKYHTINDVQWNAAVKSLLHIPLFLNRCCPWKVLPQSGTMSRILIHVCVFILIVMTSLDALYK